MTAGAIIVNIGGVTAVYLSQNDIGALLGVGRTMVNVWRGRYGDFPEPDVRVGIGKRGLPGWRPERMDDIRTWVTKHGLDAPGISQPGSSLKPPAAR